MLAQPLTVLANTPAEAFIFSATAAALAFAFCAAGVALAD
jgi:hypothetical protein